MKFLQRYTWFIPALIIALILFVWLNALLGLFLFVVLFAVGIVHFIMHVYMPYAADNPKNLWFKRKLYGWGWTPVTWQGWLLTIVYVGLIIACALTIDENSPAQEGAFTFILPVTLLTVAFIKIAYKKGESPRWQWGIK